MENYQDETHWMENFIDDPLDMREILKEIENG